MGLGDPAPVPNNPPLYLENPDTRIAREWAHRFFDRVELGGGGAAGKSELCAHSLRGFNKRSPAPGQEFRNRHLFSAGKITSDHAGRRITIHGGVIRKLNFENYFRHKLFFWSRQAFCFSNVESVEQAAHFEHPALTVSEVIPASTSHSPTG
jgi:hypothetical protein